MQRPPLERDDVLTVATAGLAGAALVLAVRTWLGLGPPAPMEPFATGWAAVGGVLVGATVAAVALVRGWYLPAVGVLALFLWATVETAQYAASLDGAVAGTFPQPFWLFTTAWPGVLLFAALLAAVEAGGRWCYRRIGAAAA